MSRQQLGRVALLAGAALVLAVLLPATAAAATGTYLRLAHLSPDTPNVDVTVTGFTGRTYQLKGVGYGGCRPTRRSIPAPTPCRCGRPPTRRRRRS